MHDMNDEFEDALDDALKEAAMNGGQISMRLVWNAAINAAIESAETRAHANESCAKEQDTLNISGESDRLKTLAEGNREIVEKLRALLVPNLNSPTDLVG